MAVPKLHSCEGCPRDLECWDAAEKHMSAGGHRRCEICGAVFHSHEDVESHYAKKDHWSYHCETCHEGLSYGGDVEFHMEKMDHWAAPSSVNMISAGSVSTPNSRLGSTWTMRCTGVCTGAASVRRVFRMSISLCGYVSLDCQLDRCPTGGKLIGVDRLHRSIADLTLIATPPRPAPSASASS